MLGADFERQQPKPKSRKRRPKRKPIRLEGFLAFVRVRACMFCQAPGPSDPHHYGPRGLGQKTDDLRTVPLCRRCHDHFHAAGYVAPFTKAETVERILREQVQLLVDWYATTALDGEGM